MNKFSDLTTFKKHLKNRTKKFAHDCVKLSTQLPGNRLGNHICGQLIRCSTSVAANYRASCIAQTVPSLISKLSIAIEEADESEFWIEFAENENLFVSQISEEVKRVIGEANAIASILIKSRMTLQSNQNSNIQKY